MLSESCPVCGYPLFKLKSGEVVCAEHGKVYIVRDEKEENKVKRDVILQSIEEQLLMLATTTLEELKKEPNDENSITQLLRYLDAIEKVSRIRTQSNS